MTNYDRKYQSCNQVNQQNFCQPKGILFLLLLLFFFFFSF